VQDDRALREPARAAPLGRVAAIDLGKKRIGLACSDELRMTVRPLGMVEARGARVDAKAIAGMLAGLDVKLVVIGLPLLPSGDEGESATRARERGDDLARRLALPHVFHDESYTTTEAQAILRERPRRGAPQVDALAAALILESWLAQQEMTS
jgi:putative Holliday junction resolvase